MFVPNGETALKHSVIGQLKMVILMICQLTGLMSMAITSHLTADGQLWGNRQTIGEHLTLLLSKAKPTRWQIGQKSLGSVAAHLSAELQVVGKLKGYYQKKYTQKDEAFKMPHPFIFSNEMG